MKKTERDIKEILRKHKLWLDTNGMEGERASFSGSNFSKTNLSESDFSRSNFFGANLYATTLQGAILRGAKSIIRFGPVGNYGRTGYAVDHGNKIMVQLGCFWGDELTATEEITKKYGPDSSYLAIVNAVCRELIERRK